MKLTTSLLTSTAIILGGCSTAAKDIAPTYISPIQYQSYDCQQIEAENARLVNRVSQLGGRLDEAASNDKAIGVVGAVLFWPALFALGGTKNQEAEYARIKGEHDALQQASIQKKCGTLQTKNITPTPEKDRTPQVPPELAAVEVDAKK
ncbi:MULTISPECIES: hypothetical protein [unclassified Simplicispira]|uniref:hypothetical protein n=1 Tax=unclassified Simplicispira TaxID=2630407 RepID=UPI000D5FA807|nr:MULTISPECIES: hypothetical protein [unclassified Simplicispira]PVY57950.1 hypothetical protein C8D04_3256 [Simplicispira sp. 125]REG18894.1 hypothetical protein C8D01_3567 [Simplicispira sp. 110]